MEVGPPSAICPFRTVAGGTAMQTVARVCSWVAVVVAVTFSPRAEAITYAGGSLNIPTINTTADTTVYPTYGSVTIQQTTNPKVTSVGYLGGPFIIGASDANTFLQLLSGSLVVKDKNGNNVDFSAFSAVTPACGAAGTTNGLGGTAPAHHVSIHRAM